jgi:hypothetical protein
VFNVTVLFVLQNGTSMSEEGGTESNKHLSLMSVLSLYGASQPVQYCILLLQKRQV